MLADTAGERSSQCNPGFPRGGNMLSQFYCCVPVLYGKSSAWGLLQCTRDGNQDCSMGHLTAALRTRTMRVHSLYCCPT